MAEAVPCSMRGRFGPIATARNGEAFSSGTEATRAIEPAVFGGFDAGRAGLHEILRVEMRARGIGRAGGVNDGELVFVKERLEWREAGVQAEEAVEIDRGVGAAAAWLRNGDGWAQAVIVWFGEWDDDVEAVGGAALEEDDELFFAGGGGSGGDGALQECGHGAEADHGDAALLQEIAAGEFEGAGAFAASVDCVHGVLPKSKENSKLGTAHHILPSWGAACCAPLHGT